MLILGYIIGLIFTAIYFRLIKCYSKLDYETGHFNKYKIKRWIYILVALFNLIPYFGFFITIIGGMILLYIIDREDLVFKEKNTILDWLNEKI